MSLAEEKSVTPHTLRHAAAMSLLHHGVDLSVIALPRGTNPPRLLRSICLPTCNSRSARSRTQQRVASHQHATTPPDPLLLPGGSLIMRTIRPNVEPGSTQSFCKLIHNAG
ncbi:hypothetical protein QCE64_17715 [Caballeronia sp. LZ043]|nr:hypothetical protein [Caballeronia sp. LZ043]MDR5822330.1 hypothetical protein [Caballeronia sp. LZ043]